MDASDTEIAAVASDVSESVSDSAVSFPFSSVFSCSPASVTFSFVDASSADSSETYSPASVSSAYTNFIAEKSLLIFAVTITMKLVPAISRFQ